MLVKSAILDLLSQFDQQDQGWADWYTIGRDAFRRYE